MSGSIIATVIRGAIGFGGALLSDDLSMKALAGSLGARSVAARAAGCDLALHCNGDLTEMTEVLEGAGALEGASARRARDALARLRAPAAFDAAAGAARLAALLAAVEPALEA
jgi:beta-N-acetylhexosaminidase